MSDLIEGASGSPLTPQEEGALGVLFDAISAHAHSQKSKSAEPFDTYALTLELRFFGDPTQLRIQALRGYRTILAELHCKDDPL